MERQKRISLLNLAEKNNYPLLTCILIYCSIYYSSEIRMIDFRSNELNTMIHAIAHVLEGLKQFI